MHRQVTGISKLLFSLQFLSRKAGGLGKTVNQFCPFRASHKAPVSRKLGTFMMAFPGPLGTQELLPDI